jgi:hypothetical protein
MVPDTVVPGAGAVRVITGGVVSGDDGVATAKAIKKSVRFEFPAAS